MLQAEAQKPGGNAIVKLFELDASPLGGPVYRWVPGSGAGFSGVMWRGDPYISLPVEAEGFEWSGQGDLPRPKLRIADADNVVGSQLDAYDDFLGATVKRWQTMARFLDGAPDADPNQYWGPEIYFVERCPQRGKAFVELELRAATDLAGVKLPRRQILRDACTHRYRAWDPVSETFTYAKATCPYTGGAFFKADGTTTTDPVQDVCGKRLSNCRQRFSTGSTVQARVPPDRGTLIGDMTEAAGLGAVFSRIGSKRDADCASKSGTGAHSAFVGKDWGVHGPRELTGYRVRAGTGSGFGSGSGGGDVTITLQASNTGTGTWDVLHTGTLPNAVDAEFEALSGLVGGRWKFHRVVIAAAGNLYLAEVDFLETVSMTAALPFRGFPGASRAR